MPTSRIIGMPGGEGEEKELKNLVEKLMKENVPNLLKLVLSDVFLMIRLGLWILRENTTRLSPLLITILEVHKIHMTPLMISG